VAVARWGSGVGVLTAARGIQFQTDLRKGKNEERKWIFLLVPLFSLAEKTAAWVGGRGRDGDEGCQLRAQHRGGFDVVFFSLLEGGGLQCSLSLFFPFRQALTRSCSDSF